MSFEILVGLFFSISSMVVARMLGNNANDKLDAEKKLLLSQIFSKIKYYQLIPLAVIMFIFLVGFSYFKSYFLIIFFITIALIFIHFLILNIYIINILKKNDYPKSYIAIITLSQFVRIIGVIILFTFFYLYMIKKIIR